MRTWQPVDLLRGPAQPRTGWVLLVLGALAASWQAQSLWSELEATETLRRTDVADARRKATAEPVAERARLFAWGEVARRLGVPWSDWLSMIEQGATGHATLLKLEQEAEGGALRVTGQSRDTAGMMKYVRALERDPRVAGVLLRQHALVSDERGTRVEFELAASWLGAVALPAGGEALAARRTSNPPIAVHTGDRPIVAAEAKVARELATPLQAAAGPR